MTAPRSALGRVVLGGRLRVPSPRASVSVPVGVLQLSVGRLGRLGDDQALQGQQFADHGLHLHLLFSSITCAGLDCFQLSWALTEVGRVGNLPIS